MKIPKDTDIVVVCTGLFCCIIATSALLGYVLRKQSLYDWSGKGLEGMAVNSSICFLLIGFCLVLLGRRIK